MEKDKMRKLIILLILAISIPAIAGGPGCGGCPSPRAIIRPMPPTQIIVVQVH
jgi:hypothetical protein